MLLFSSFQWEVNQFCSYYDAEMTGDGPTAVCLIRPPGRIRHTAVAPSPVISASQQLLCWLVAHLKEENKGFLLVIFLRNLLKHCSFSEEFHQNIKKKSIFLFSFCRTTTLKLTAFSVTDKHRKSFFFWRQKNTFSPAKNTFKICKNTNKIKKKV